MSPRGNGALRERKCQECFFVDKITDLSYNANIEEDSGNNLGDIDTGSILEKNGESHAEVNRRLGHGSFVRSFASEQQDRGTVPVSSLSPWDDCTGTFEKGVFNF